MGASRAPFTSDEQRFIHESPVPDNTANSHPTHSPVYAGRLEANGYCVCAGTT